MMADPGQRTPVNRQHPEVLRKLAEHINSHREEFMSGYYQDDRPFIIAHPGMKFTQLPARDGIAHGNIQRSNRFPNCSFFKNWKAPSDKITFDAEVPKPGTFRVHLYYAAREAGAKCELRFKDSVLKFTIEEAHDVPLQGAENDRHPRKNSYVKDFKSIPIGKIDLAAGAGTLTLQATEIPGNEAMEFRLLLLERLE